MSTRPAASTAAAALPPVNRASNAYRMHYSQHGIGSLIPSGAFGGGSTSGTSGTNGTAGGSYVFTLG